MIDWLIFFAIIIISVYDRFAEGASPVLISLLLISYKYGIWCFLGVGPYHTFLGSTVGFLYEPLGPTVGQLQLSLPLPLPASPPPPKKKLPDKCSGEKGMIEIDRAIKERLSQKKAN